MLKWEWQSRTWKFFILVFAWGGIWKKVHSRIGKCTHSGVHCWYTLWWFLLCGNEHTAIGHSKFLLDIFFKKLLPSCYCAISLLVWFTTMEFSMLFESLPYSKICFLRILCSEYLVGLNLLNKTWTFRTPCLWAIGGTHCHKNGDKARFNRIASPNWE